MKRFNMMQEANNHVEHKYNNKQNSILIYLPIIIAFVVIYLMHTNNEVNIKSGNIELVKKYNSLKSEYDKLSQLSPEISETNKLAQEKSELSSKLLGMKSINKEKVNFMEFMLQIKENISEKVALLRLHKKYADIEIEGIAQDNLSISEFIELLEKTQTIKGIKLKLSEYVNEYGPYKQKFVINGEII